MTHSQINIKSLIAEYPPPNSASDLPDGLGPMSQPIHVASGEGGHLGRAMDGEMMGVAVDHGSPVHDGIKAWKSDSYAGLIMANVNGSSWLLIQ